MDSPAALSGLWMTLFYDRAGPTTARCWHGMRLVFGTAMALAIVARASLAVRRRDFARHRAWMIRGYAIGLGAGTQAFTHLPWLAGRRPARPGRAGRC